MSLGSRLVGALIVSVCTMQMALAQAAEGAGVRRFEVPDPVSGQAMEALAFYPSPV